MSWACAGEKINAYSNLKERGHLEDLGIDDSIYLKEIGSGLFQTFPLAGSCERGYQRSVSLKELRIY
jgi:hypothetical protein